MPRAARGEGIGQFLLGRVTGWVGRCYGGRPRVRFGKVGQGACCGLEELLVFLLLVCRCYPRSVMVSVRCYEALVRFLLAGAGYRIQTSDIVIADLLCSPAPCCSLRMDILDMGPSRLALWAQCDHDCTCVGGQHAYVQLSSELSGASPIAQDLQNTFSRSTKADGLMDICPAGTTLPH